MGFDVRSVAPGQQGSLRLLAGTLAFGDDEVELGALDAGDVIILAWADIAEAFDAGTTNVLTLGDGTTADKFLAAGDITEGTPGVSAAKGPFAAEAAAGTLTATYAQTGDAATEGEATFFALVTKAPA